MVAWPLAVYEVLDEHVFLVPIVVPVQQSTE